MSSLQWDSFEQFCVWQLLSAEGPDVQTIIIILEKLSLEGKCNKVDLFVRLWVIKIVGGHGEEGLYDVN